MDIFYHCTTAVLEECNKNGLTINKDVSKIENSTDINFDLPANRVAFFYKFGAFNIHFFKKCFTDFATGCPEFSSVVERMLASKLVCSLSNGPGTDIIGLQLALKELNKTFNKSTFFKIINQYGSWRNTMNTLIESKTSTLSLIGSFKLMQGNVMESLNSKTENCLKSADVILMDHAFASPNAQKSRILNALKILLELVKPGAYIFFIDTKNKMSYFELLNSHVTYIYGPKAIQVDDMPYNKKIAEQIGEEPVHCGKAYFGVWQKNMKTENVIIVDSVSLVNVIPALGNVKENMKPVENKSSACSPIKKQLENITTTLLANTITAPQLHCSTSNAFASGTQQFPSISDKKNIGCGFTTETNSETFNNVSARTEDMATLLQSLNTLVTKLEDFLMSETSSRNSSSLKFYHIPTCGCQNQCLNNHHCCLNTRYCSQCDHHG